MRATGLNARYWRPGVEIQSKCQTNEQRRRSEELRTIHDLSAIPPVHAGRDAGLPAAIFEFCRMKFEAIEHRAGDMANRIFPRLPCRRRFESMPAAATSKTRCSRGH
jgi:hypothetical protein